MNFDAFDKFKDGEDCSEEDYEKFVEWLQNLTSAELRKVKGNWKEEKTVLCRYYKRGDKANLSIPELIDFLGVSSPSILDKAGYTDEESAALFEISDTLTQEEIHSVEL